MTLWKAQCVIVLGAALSMPGTAHCETFPGPLLGKSVTLTWTVNRQQRFEKSGAIVSRTSNVTLQIYISTAGRAFSKESGTFSGLGGAIGNGGMRPVGGVYQEDRAPDDAGKARGANVVHAEGRALLVDRQMVEGARRVSIAFGPGYGSCTAHVIIGREGGTGAIIGRSRLNGERFEVLSIQVSTPNCTVTSGNVFGEQ